MDRGPEEIRSEGGQQGGRRDASPEVRERLSRNRGEIDPDPSATEDELESLRLELARTRAQMSETVYALQSRANPTYVKEQATEQVKNSGPVQTVKENPVPAAMTGVGLIGLGWLIVSGKRQDSEGQGGEQSSRQQSLPEAGYREPYRHEYPYGPSNSYDSGDSGAEQGRAGQSAEQARKRASEMGGQAQERASQAGDKAREQAQRAKGGFQQALQENPLALGAAVIGIGAAVGLVIPGTAKENELMGESRDQLANRTQRQAQETSQRIQRVAEEAQKAAKEEADNQDLAE